MFREDLKYTRTAAYQARARLMDSWCELGLAKSPFAGASSQASGIKLAHYQGVLDSINMFANSDETFAIVSGVSGAGKTSICDSFVIETDTTTCVINCNSAMPGEALFEQLLFDSGLEIPTNSISESAKISLFIDEVARRSENIILILDDAHMLNVGAMKMVLDLLARQKNSTFLKVIMCGRETLYERVIKQYTHDISIRPLHFMVTPLPEHQLKAYLHSCLVKGNWPGVLPEIPASVLKQIYDLSDGVPFRINLAADKLLCNYLQSQINSSSSSVRPESGSFLSYNFLVNCFMSVCYLVLLCGCYGWYSSVLSPTKYAAEEPTNIRALEPLQPEVTQVASTEPTKINMVPKNQSPQMNNAEFLKYLGAKIDVDKTKVDIKSQVREEHRQFSKQSINRISPIKQLPPQTSYKPQPQVNLFRDKSILSQQKGYTLQVMASNSLDTIVKFKDSSILRDKMYIYETTRDRKHWYVLTYSNFNNYNTAKNAQQILQVKHNISGAWVKSLNQVHSDMNRTLY